MADVEEDLVSGHRATYVASSADVTRTFRVSNLTADPWAQLDEALTDPGIPDIGDFYPSPPTNNLRVRQKDAVPDGPNAARVICLYSNKQGPTWNQAPPLGDGQDVKQVSFSVTPKTSTVDAFGDPMTLTPPPSASSLQPYRSEAQIQAPVGELVFERTESAVPSSRMRAKVGRVNGDILGGGNYQIYTLLFAKLDAHSDDGGATWRVTYAFRFDPDGWIHTDRWKIPTGKVPNDSVETTFVPYKAATFGDLGLDFSDAQTPL